MNEYIDKIIKISTALNEVDEKKAFEMGYDCAKSGANETNCHFALFSKPEFTKAWETGKDKYFEGLKDG